MFIRGLSFYLLRKFGECFPKDYNRLRSFHFYSFFGLNSIFNDFQMKFSHPGHQILSSLFIDLNLDRRVFSPYFS